jgi:hypothetical protein
LPRKTLARKITDVLVAGDVKVKVNACLRLTVLRATTVHFLVTLRSSCTRSLPVTDFGIVPVMTTARPAIVAVG